MPKNRKIRREIQDNDNNKKKIQNTFLIFLLLFLFVCFFDNKKERLSFKKAKVLHLS